MNVVKDFFVRFWGNTAARAVVLLFLTACVGAGAMAAVNMLTEDVIENREADELKKTLRAVFPDAAEFIEDRSVIAEGSSVLRFYAAMDDSSVHTATETGLAETPAGFAVFAAPRGRGGVIELAVGVSYDGAVTYVSVLDTDEIQEIGAKVDDGSFLRQFRGKRAGISVGRGENSIDAVAGATISSRAVIAGVNDALAAVGEYIAREAELYNDN